MWDGRPKLALSEAEGPVHGRSPALLSKHSPPPVNQRAIQSSIPRPK
jgi:hypothetical protein